MMKCRLFPIICLAGLLMPVLLQAQHEPTFDPAYQFVQSGNLVQDKNFYLLTLFEQEPALQKAIRGNKALQQYQVYPERAAKIAKGCPNASCFAASLVFSDQQIIAIGQILQDMYNRQPAFRETLQRHLRPSGVFMRYASMPEDKLLAQRWKEEAYGLNYVLTAYTQNKGLRYPKIDSAAYDVRSADYTKEVRKRWVQTSARKDPSMLFFSPVLQLAMDLLELNGKDHAARHEPLSTLNRAAYQQLPGTQWAAFPYAAILILGAGPTGNEPISEMCKERCRMGAALYRDKKAPFVIVSGGYVHPFGTRYSEAIEMKRFLKDSCGIPETAIIAEPHARHTTTNIRNANRILFRNGFPANKKVLCTSSKIHITYVNSIFFNKTCDKDLRYHPCKNVKRLDDNSLEYEPVAESLHEDPFDPLDP
ncbi:YdcF family protein [uncultured Chitinophaga sp.]|jgi:Uncharacterized conserved protein|uniref:YdcF family protein n=1 Tax=uncultured Chitinophaga sp. TaxID=339340 RepID=UPI00260F6CDB|nr:YdcF family protein [uncultured Chitinophaga sp.]